MLHNLISTQIHHESWSIQAFLTTMKSLSVILFFSLLRSSSLIPPYPAALDPKRQLIWKNVRRLGSKGVILPVLLEKNNQFQERIHHVALAAKPGSPFCPVQALDNLLLLRNGEKCEQDDLVFQLPLGRGAWRPLVRYEFNAWFSKRVREMGLDPKQYLIHGFKHGGINLALRLEPNLQMVKVTTNHLSDAIFSYSHLPPQDRFQVSEKMVDFMTD